MNRYLTRIDELVEKLQGCEEGEQYDVASWNSAAATELVIEFERETLERAAQLVERFAPWDQASEIANQIRALVTQPIDPRKPLP